MHKVYENIYIGNFIYLLGVISERERLASSKEANLSVSLYQQTPSDPHIGDFFSTLDGRSIIIEFKKDEASIDKKEVEKQEQLYYKLKNKETDPDLKTLSTSCHFLGVGENISGGSANIHFRLYTKLPNGTPITTPIETFISNYCTGKKINIHQLNNLQYSTTIGSDSKKFKDYLELLRSLNSSKRTASSGGLIVNISPEGKINLLSTPNIQSLLQHLSDLNQSLQKAAPQPAFEPKNAPQLR
ncbi:hypothetical protein [Teredinibacter sp. KSP-S5-2]|uniref:hypothetical protein n=1 Tax=Teredinibacter sp. KSP-S5-2 TaxID=3034506 RepID=UPI0029345763|nr:hypothetical protein [Teredinibacter sp. KSP-S5-2]WNO10394.1 hypothetical protein P5V12_04345 [Teredinibacter sp. KSP-S5-2]